MKLTYQKKTILWMLALVMLMGRSFLPAKELKTSPSEFDGNWWLSASSDEQDGYLNGDADCATWELKIKAKYSHSIEENQKFITQFYNDNPSRRSDPVFQVSRKAEDIPAPPRPQGGEVWTEPHGYLDGDWWTQSSPLNRVGFVEGYLRCYAQKRSKKKVHFSKKASFYVEQINRWYRVDDPPPIPLKISEEKIATVLFKFRDEASRNESPKSIK